MDTFTNKGYVSFWNEKVNDIMLYCTLNKYWNKYWHCFQWFILHSNSINLDDTLVSELQLRIIYSGYCTVQNWSQPFSLDITISNTTYLPLYVVWIYLVPNAYSAVRFFFDLCIECMHIYSYAPSSTPVRGNIVNRETKRQRDSRTNKKYIYITWLRVYFSNLVNYSLFPV